MPSYGVGAPKHPSMNILDTDPEEERSRGAQTKDLLSLRMSRTDPSLMKKLLESEAPLAAGGASGSIGAASSSLSSSNEISVSTNTSELTR